MGLDLASSHLFRLPTVLLRSSAQPQTRLLAQDWAPLQDCQMIETCHSDNRPEDIFLPSSSGRCSQVSEMKRMLAEDQAVILFTTDTAGSQVACPPLPLQ